MAVETPTEIFRALGSPATALALAFLLDVTVSEFPERVHPVVWFGRVVGRFDREWRRPRATGLVLAVALPLAAGGTLAALTAIAFRAGAVFGTAVAALALFSTFSYRMLLSRASEVIALTESNAETARDNVHALVGRDADSLSPEQLRSAAVESAAENLADGLVGPVLAFAAGSQLSLAVGVGAAATLKAINTMDSMLGYHSKPVGSAAARLDDLVMWLPARASAVLLALAAWDPGAVGRGRPWADRPASPNSGWPMATLAAAASVKLSKPGAYTLNEIARYPTVEQANSCLRVVAIAGVLAVAAAAVLARAEVMVWL
ncbi:adenosylcobinamide-phosphate synthase CbiB [Halovenus salina]|uniref:Probable cobalamin biosynthesis protein CobD n=1 Tax=Halovenus salina TaxID=1510225 RepID=A0ABD5VYB3_9EURY|nr:adenosylcobinamide-phosphate synthase CbiB [Halovenus salina]